MATKTLTKADEYRRRVSKELSEAHERLGKANRKLEHAKSHLRGAKGDVDSAQADVNELVEQLRDIQNGNYQPTLFDKKPSANGKATKKLAANAPDDGTATPIETLADHGLTTKQCEKLRESELEIATIGDLETCMREDEWWHKRVKGFGPTNIDKLTDALLSFRKAHPVPSPDEAESIDRQNDDASAAYTDRSAPGGTACEEVARCSWEHGMDFVTVGIGNLDDGTYRSSVLFRVGDQQPVGRDTPREDSQPHKTQAEAARAAVTELIEAWERAGGKRKAMAEKVAAWRDERWAAPADD